ncbi:hypothetical protein HanPI659440_Chr03g0117011 [Helianthus annuus]|nr:hypothetical protein HanPI659440_Chr03g0117011 [Helianthus annuus]
MSLSFPGSHFKSPYSQQQNSDRQHQISISFQIVQITNGQIWFLSFSDRRQRLKVGDEDADGGGRMVYGSAPIQDVRGTVPIPSSLKLIWYRCRQ